MKRLLKRFLAVVLVVAGLLAVIVYGTRTYMAEVGTRELAQVRARLDAAEPGWTLEAIEASRQQAAPPAEQNSATLVLRVADQIGPEHNKEWSTWRSSDAWTGRYLSPRLPSAKFLERMNTHKDATAEARRLARDISRYPTGYYPLTVHRNPFLTLLPHVQKAREVAAILEYDALLAAVEKDPDAALVAVHAALNAGRSIGDEQFLISQLVRLACCRISTQTAMQVLAWGEPKRGLAELQAAYRAEADVPWVLNGIRGERAAVNRLFSGLASGQLTGDDLSILGAQKPGVIQNAGLHLYKGLLPGDHAKALEILTAHLEAVKLPHHEQQAAVAAIRIPLGPPEDFRYIVTRLVIPACDKMAAAGLRTRADLLCASTAIACERFRQANGRWPDRLEDIPKDILPDLPPDPFTGQPLQYQKFEDGVAMFSVGDRDPNAARRHVENKDPLAGIGQGYRLWSPTARRQPAPPEPVEPPEGEPKLP